MVTAIIDLSNSESPTGGTSSRFIYLSLLERHLAYALAWQSEVDVFKHILYTDGAFGILRSTLVKNGIIFTDSQPFQHLLEPNAFKYKVICVTRILHLRRFKTACAPYNDVLAKIASVLDPSSCVLALGTWQLPIAWAINALRSNSIPASITMLSPLLPTPPHVWGDWIAAIARSPTKSYCAILNVPSGLDVISLMFGIVHYWTSPL
ncbi:MAG: hypothetical protein ACTS6A_02700 [Candidatus Hodgkinia cicadicola]